MRLHHVGYLVRDIDSAAGTWCLRYGYSRASEIVADPVQTARVLLLELPGDTTMVELITPIGEESRLSNALKKGVRLHHLCYECDDIETAGEHLRDEGMYPIMQPTDAEAFPGDRVSWFMDREGFLVELVTGKGFDRGRTEAD